MYVWIETLTLSQTHEYMNEDLDDLKLSQISPLLCFHGRNHVHVHRHFTVFLHPLDPSNYPHGVEPSHHFPSSVNSTHVSSINCPPGDTVAIDNSINGPIMRRGLYSPPFVVCQKGTPSFDNKIMLIQILFLVYILVWSVCSWTWELHEILERCCLSTPCAIEDQAPNFVGMSDISCDNSWYRSRKKKEYRSINWERWKSPIQFEPNFITVQCTIWSQEFFMCKIIKKSLNWQWF